MKKYHIKFPNDKFLRQRYQCDSATVYCEGGFLYWQYEPPSESMKGGQAGFVKRDGRDFFVLSSLTLDADVIEVRVEVDEGISVGDAPFRLDSALGYRMEQFYFKRLSFPDMLSMSIHQLSREFKRLVEAYIRKWGNERYFNIVVPANMIQRDELYEKNFANEVIQLKDTESILRARDFEFSMYHGILSSNDQLRFAHTVLSWNGHKRIDY